MRKTDGGCLSSQLRRVPHETLPQSQLVAEVQQTKLPGATTSQDVGLDSKYELYEVFVNPAAEFVQPLIFPEQAKMLMRSQDEPIRALLPTLKVSEVAGILEEV